MTKTLVDPLVKEEGIKEGVYKVAKLREGTEH